MSVNIESIFSVNYISYCALCRFCVRERVEWVEVGGVTCRVTCIWWLLGLAVKAPWLRLGTWANSCPGCMDRFRKHYSHLVGGSFLAGMAAWALSRHLTTESTDYCMLINEWMVKIMTLLWLKVELGSVLESELGQKRRCGALKACIG